MKNTLVFIFAICAVVLTSAQQWGYDHSPTSTLSQLEADGFVPNFDPNSYPNGGDGDFWFLDPDGDDFIVQGFGWNHDNQTWPPTNNHHGGFVNHNNDPTQWGHYYVEYDPQADCYNYYWYSPGSDGGQCSGPGLLIQSTCIE